MSTSEQSLVTPVIPEANSAGAGLPGSAPGILSPAELARMANAMFNALPDESQQPAIAAARVCCRRTPLQRKSVCRVPGPTVPAVPGILAGFAELQPGAFVATPDHSVPPDARSSASVPSSPVSSQAGRGSAPLPHPIPQLTRPLHSSPMRALSMLCPLPIPHPRHPGFCIRQRRAQRRRLRGDSVFASNGCSGTAIGWHAAAACAGSPWGFRRGRLFGVSDVQFS